MPDTSFNSIYSGLPVPPDRAHPHSHGTKSRERERTDKNGSRYYEVRSEGTKYGIGFGSALAIAISYTTNKSILWAIIHGILGWLYVIYFALFHS